MTRGFYSGLRVQSQARMHAQTVTIPKDIQRMGGSLAMARRIWETMEHPMD